jgi:acetyl-CoA decarbonylase/synthase complex subunit alpha
MRKIIMSKKDLNVKLKQFKTDLGVIENLELSIGRIFEDSWTEPVGPTPYPSITELRDWDFTLLRRYQPFYLPFCDVCCLCTFGKCDLTGNKRGACGLDMAAQQSRIVLLAC